MAKKHFKILLVEDDFLFAEGVKSFLSTSKSVFFDVIHVDTLKKGLRKIADGGIDLILTDLSLPDSWGLDTVKKEYYQVPEVPIVVLTSFADEEMAIKALQIGAQDYLYKSDINQDLLIRSIRFAIERQFRIGDASEDVDDMEAPSHIRVLLVDDSLIALGILKKMLHSSPHIQVVGTAVNGREALSLIPQLQPNVICTDLEMPVMDGLEFTKEVMAKYPRPVLVVSSAIQEGDSQRIFELLEAGAVDVYPKPQGGLRIKSMQETFARQFVEKVKEISQIAKQKPIPRNEATTKEHSAKNKAETSVQVVVIGASVGGPQALKKILPKLPADFPIPIICVQIINREFVPGLVAWLNSNCALKVEVVKSGLKPQPGVIYFPSGDMHLEIDENGYFSCTNKPPFKGHRPSITTTFQSVVEFYGGDVLGVLLTGMGHDGAEGMKVIANAGGITIVQDEETSFSFNLPQQAIELGVIDHILPLFEIPNALMKFIN